jgi:hypothetical protein
VFGLRITGDLPGRGPWPAVGTATARRAQLERVEPTRLARAWGNGDSETLLRVPVGDGGPVLAIDAHPIRGYLVRADGFGAYEVSPDGRRVLVAPGAVEEWRWQRLLTAQALPIAALAHGLELFHASAVELDGAALAFTGASGAGKSTLAARLVLEGASFISDDVLSVERVGEDVIAHPGPPLMNLRESPASSLSARERSRLGVEIGRDEAAVRLHVRGASRASTLGAIYLLRRSMSAAARIRVERLSPPSPPQLLGAGFGSAITTPARLVRRLDLCAHLARRVAVFALEVPPHAPPAAVAEAVRQHARRSSL